MSTSIRNDVASVLEPFYRQVIGEFASRTFEALQRKSIQDYQGIYNTFMLEVGGSRITDISRLTQRIIVRTIVKNQTEGVAPIAKAIRDRFSEKMTKSRSATIARTETHTASSYAIQKQAENMEAPELRKRWVSTSDDRTRSSHASVNGQEVGVNEDFIVNGRKMSYTGDPKGGASETINCRCVVVYIEPEDIITDQEVAEKPIVFVPKPKIKIPQGFLNPVRDKTVTGNTIKILSLGKATKQIQDQVKEASKDSRYLNKENRIYRSRETEMFGEADFEGMTDESVSMILAIKPEIDALADKFGVPKLRGFIPEKRSRVNGSMGDGIMSLNDDYVNGLSRKMVVLKPDAQDVNAIEEITLNKIKESKVRDNLRFKLNELMKKHKVESWYFIKDKNDYDLADRYDQQIIRIRKNIVIYDEGIQKYSNNGLTVSTWKYGDNIKDRPWTSDAFENNGLDKFRTTFYHEMGHHVHQMYKLRIKEAYQKPRSRYYDNMLIRPLEIKLSKSIRNIKKLSPTEYGATNTKEWFVENFALYFMDKKSLIDPRFEILLKEMFNDKIF